MAFKQRSVLLHGGAAAIMAYGYNSLHDLPMNAWIETQKGGHFQFLTIQGCVRVRETRGRYLINESRIVFRLRGLPWC